MHNPRQEELLQDFLAVHAKVAEALEKGDADAFQSLAKMQAECVRRLLNSEPMTNSRNYETLTDIKSAVDRACQALEREKAKVWSQIRSAKTALKCTMAYVHGKS
ncbi:MAG: hypothetical protein P8175_19575 [Deltaproteobacteria bacterium]